MLPDRARPFVEVRCCNGPYVMRPCDVDVLSEIVSRRCGGNIQSIDIVNYQLCIGSSTMLQVDSAISGLTGCSGFLARAAHPQRLAKSSPRFFSCCLETLNDVLHHRHPSRENGSRIVSSNARSTSGWSGSPTELNHSERSESRCATDNTECTVLFNY